VPLARALVDGGLPVAEITFRTAAASEGIRGIARDVPEMILVAGTVLTMQQLEQAVEAGAIYIVSPGFHPAIVDWCLARGVAITPGVAAPSEVIVALSALKHSVPGDLNLVALAEVQQLVAGSMAVFSAEASRN